MRTRFSLTRRTTAFTNWDLLLLLTVNVLLGFVCLSLLSRPRARAPRINCTSNLKQVGLAARMFANDHDDKFPWALPKEQFGTLELIGVGDVFPHFLAMSNELVSPKILCCPADKARSRVMAFKDVTDNNLSYFVGLDASEGAPQSILAGDRDLSPNSLPMSGLLSLTQNGPLQWTDAIHKGGGNSVLGDGSAPQLTTGTLHKQVRLQQRFPVRLAIP